MARNMADIMAGLPRERRKNVLDRAAEIEGALTLRQLRETLGITQKELADMLAVSQASVSKQERRGDMRLNTLYRIMEALGGSLKITAVIPGKGEIELETSPQRETRS